MLGCSNGDSWLFFWFLAIQLTRVCLASYWNTGHISAEVFFKSKSSTALLLTGVEVACGNGNVHSRSSHTMMMIMMMLKEQCPFVQEFVRASELIRGWIHYVIIPGWCLCFEWLMFVFYNWLHDYNQSDFVHCVFIARCYASTVYAVVVCRCVCVSVCLSVTFWYCIKMAKRRIMQRMSV